MNNKKINKNLEKRLFSIFRVYLATYLVLEKQRSKNKVKKMQKVIKNATVTN